jgi:hypothetical protein
MGIRLRLGRRGLLLILLGAAYVTIGTGFVLVPMERFSRPGPGGILNAMDSPWVGALWIVGGVLAVASGILRPWTLRDGYGFNGLALPPFLWMAGYAWSTVAYVVTAGALGRANAWIAAIVYLALTAIVLFLARWPDPDDPHLRDMPTEERPG